MMVNPKPKVHSVEREFIAESGPGSRQPKLKLPLIEVNGKRSTLHPLTALMRLRGMTTKDKTALAASMGIKPQSLYKWELACAVDRNFPIPVLRARQLADFFKVPPATFRPDFPWDGTKVKPDKPKPRVRKPKATPSNEAVEARAA
jgi:hypothetical protein